MRKIKEYELIFLGYDALHCKCNYTVKYLAKNNRLIQFPSSVEKELLRIEDGGAAGTEFSLYCVQHRVIQTMIHHGQNIEMQQ